MVGRDRLLVCGYLSRWDEAFTTSHASPNSDENIAIMSSWSRSYYRRAGWGPDTSNYQPRLVDILDFMIFFNIADCLVLQSPDKGQNQCLKV